MILRALFIVAVILAAISAWRVYDTRQDIHTLEKAELDTVLGNPQGTLTFVEFMDYRCPGCRFLNPTIKRLITDYPDLRVVIRHLPIYPESSIRDCRFALAAAMQGKFQEAHERLIVREEGLTEEEIAPLAKEIGLDAERLKADMMGPVVARNIISTINAAKKYGFFSIPSFMINGVHYSNSPQNKHVPAYEDFVRVIEERKKQ